MALPPAFMWLETPHTTYCTIILVCLGCTVLAVLGTKSLKSVGTNTCLQWPGDPQLSTWPKPVLFPCNVPHLSSTNVMRRQRTTRYVLSIVGRAQAVNSAPNTCHHELTPHNTARGGQKITKPKEEEEEVPNCL